MKAGRRKGRWFRHEQLPKLPLSNAVQHFGTVFRPIWRQPLDCASVFFFLCVCGSQVPPVFSSPVVIPKWISFGTSAGGFLLTPFCQIDTCQVAVLGPLAAESPEKI